MFGKGTRLARVGAFLLSAFIAWVFYVLWNVIETSGTSSPSDGILAASFFAVFGGFSAALLLMPLTWVLAVWIQRRTQWPGAAYFGILGAFLMVAVGCAVSSVFPKPLFMEDQTFWEGVWIAFERQGVCLALAGAILGIGYWYLGERNIIQFATDGPQR